MEKDFFVEAKALTPKARKELDDSDFCGPGRSFPVPDCEHVGVARAYLNRSKFSDSTKAKIKSCISKKAKAMKCANAVEASLSDDFSLKDLTVAQITLSNSDVFVATRDLVNKSLVSPGQI